MNVWQQHFKPSYIRSDGLAVIHDVNIPRLDTFTSDANEKSTVILPSEARGGDHLHRVREELFVGLGKGLVLYLENPVTKEQVWYDMDISAETGQCTVFHIPTGLAHAVHNHGKDLAILIEFATHPQEKEPYKIKFSSSTI